MKHIIVNNDNYHDDFELRICSQVLKNISTRVYDCRLLILDIQDIICLSNVVAHKMQLCRKSTFLTFSFIRKFRRDKKNIP